MPFFRNRSRDDDDLVSRRLQTAAGYAEKVWPDSAGPELETELSQTTEIQQSEEGSGLVTQPGSQTSFEHTLVELLKREKSLQDRLTATNEELKSARERRRQTFLAGDGTEQIDALLTRLERDVADLTVGLEENLAEISASEKNLALLKLRDAQRELWYARKRQIEHGQQTLRLRLELLTKVAEETAASEEVTSRQVEVERLGGPKQEWARVGLQEDAAPDTATVNALLSEADTMEIQVDKALAALSNPGES